MIHLGDITKMTADKTPFVDCITFGSPCQDLSVAGNRAGLDGERSGLFMEAVKVINGMREKSDGLYPTFAVWENVPGAFSSNKGEDFRTVLEELARICEAGVSIPGPEKGKWKKSGFIAGDRWSIAWRTLDAQYWGVPQRRKRIALVLDLRGQRAGEILFERTGVSGHLEPSIPPWKGVARNPASCTAGYDRVAEREDGRAYTLKIRSGCEGGSKGALVQTEKSATLYTLQDQTLFVSIPVTSGFVCNMGAKAHGIGWEIEKSPTVKTDASLAVCAGALAANPGMKQQTFVAKAVYCRAHGQSNAETFDNCSPTLSCNHEQPIVFESHSQDARYTQQENTSPACTAQWGTGGNNMPLVAEPHGFSPAGFSQYIERVSTLRASGGDAGNGSETLVCVPPKKRTIRWIVRRLTPVECERLQGYPVGWTDIGEWYDEKGKKHKPADSPRYKAMGNSIALPQWWWLICKMAKYLPEKPTLGSLFDGVGGFPLVWETRFGKGTAVWASEIELFPIAVTKVRFPE